MPPSRREFFRQLEASLGTEYRCWQAVPNGTGDTPAAFIILHPHRGLLYLELRNWGPERFQASLPGLEKTAASGPLDEVRENALALVRELEMDPQLTFSRGRLQGQLRFPWSWGLILSQVRRDQVQGFGLGDPMDARRVLCLDEMGPDIADPNTSPGTIVERLWAMFPLPPFGQLSPLQLQRIRWQLFPDLRLPDGIQGKGRVLDEIQERVALDGEGHRVILGPAGTGKTTLLLHQAARLARHLAKPVLILCLNKALARRLEHEMHALGTADRVHIGTFPAWCHRLLTLNHLGLPGGDPGETGYADALAERVGQGLDRQRIASAQYDALLIDDGHGFPAAWLALALRLLDPLSDVLMLAADEDQLPQGRDAFLAGLQTAGIRCRSRVSRLVSNHRNTPEILEFAARCCLQEGDGLERPPDSTGEAVGAPIGVRLNNFKEEAAWLAERLIAAHRNGMPWQQMAVLYLDWETQGKQLNSLFRQAGIPMTWQDGIRFGDRQDTLKLISFQGVQGLEFPLVGIPGLPTPPLEPKEASLWRMALLRARETLLVSGRTLPKTQV